MGRPSAPTWWPTFSTNSNWRASAKRTRRSSAKRRNKTFRDGYGALRCVAIDGGEPFSSYDRHCPNCLVRRVKVKRRTGELEEVEQYYLNNALRRAFCRALI